jgi:hypothetical protein
MRSQLKLSSKKINTLISRLEKNEERLQNMREVVKELVVYIHKSSIGGPSRALGSSLFETNEEVEQKRQNAKELGQSLVKLSAECVKRTAGMDALPRDRKLREILGKQSAAVFFKPFDTDFPPEAFSANGTTSFRSENEYSTPSTAAALGTEIEDIESMLVKQLHEWLSVLG